MTEKTLNEVKQAMYDADRNWVIADIPYRKIKRKYKPEPPNDKAISELETAYKTLVQAEKVMLNTRKEYLDLVRCNVINNT